MLRVRGDVLGTGAAVLRALGDVVREARVHVRADALLEVLILLRRHCRGCGGSKSPPPNSLPLRDIGHTVLEPQGGGAAPAGAPAGAPLTHRLSPHHAHCLARAAAGAHALELRHLALGGDVVGPLRALRVADLSLVACPLDPHTQLHALWRALARHLRVVRIAPLHAVAQRDRAAWALAALAHCELRVPSALLPDRDPVRHRTPPPPPHPPPRMSAIRT